MQVVLFVRNQISIEQDGILALIFTAHWLAHEMAVANRKLESLGSSVESKVSKCSRNEHA